eukprot:SAG31_NODE_613_length_13545_cov_10.972557_6_plen_57_part_00
MGGDAANAGDAHHDRDMTCSAMPSVDPIGHAGRTMPVVGCIIKYNRTVLYVVPIDP